MAGRRFAPVAAVAAVAENAPGAEAITGGSFRVETNPS
jgi:hypothetical protein